MFIKQALSGKHEWWRYVIGFLVIFCGWQIVGYIPLQILKAIYGVNGTGLIEMAHELGTNIFLAGTILGFAIGVITMYLWVVNNHQLPFKKLITSRPRIDYKRFFVGFLAIIVVNGLIQVIDYYQNPESYILNFNPQSFIVLFVVVLFLPIQTSFEEFLFRGYLMQGLGVSSGYKGVALIVTSAVFGLMHFANPEVAMLGPMVMVYYIGTGLTLGILTLMDEGMELSLGFHAGNNMLAALLVTTDYSAIQTDSIFKDISNPSLGFDVLFPILVQIILIALFAKLYKWNNWKEKLFGKVSSNTLDH